VFIFSKIFFHDRFAQIADTIKNISKALALKHVTAALIGRLDRVAPVCNEHKHAMFHTYSEYSTECFT
jgi:hypothetical protein